jgi:hypothetical protein
MKYIAAKDAFILFKKLLVTLALYLIPVLFVWGSLTLVKKLRSTSPASTKQTEQLQVVDN